MRLSRCEIAIAILFIVVTLNQVSAMAQQDAPPASCHVTLPAEGTMPSTSVPATQVGIGADGRVAAYGTEKLWTMLPIDGTWRGWMPSRPGDFAYENKLPWRGAFSYKDGPLKVTGQRLDGAAPSFTEFEPISGQHAFMGFISIPVFGCWQITGQYKDEKLSFVVWVTRMQAQEPASAQIPQPLEPASVPRRIHVDSETEAESLVYRVTPELPHEAQVANVSGTVVLHAIIGTDGRPHDLRYVSGPPLLANAAINAVTWWQYRVDELNVEVDTTIPVVFAAREN
ncbi:MAG: energy transducer TonB [Acidobacteriota bacterium]